MTMRTVDRRTFLRASGVALAVPMLETMQPVFARAASASPRRMVSICNTLGLYSGAWFPQTSGSDYAASEYLKHLDHHRERYTVLSNLSHAEQSGRQAHNSEITWLTSAKHPGMDGFQNTISLDQVVASHYGYATRFPSVVMGTATAQSQSFTATGVMVPADASPANLFAKLFLQGTAEEVRRQTQSLDDGGSILDRLQSETTALRARVSAGDQQRLDAYFDAVRTAELNLSEVKAWQDAPKPVVAVEPLTDVDHADIIGRVRLLFQLIPLILETDSSRVVSLMIQDHGVVPTVEGVMNDQHSLSHHGRDEYKIAQLKKIEHGIVRHFGTLLDALHERTDSNGSFLDHTTVLFGSNLGNANSHEAKHLPILVAGGGHRHGEHVIHEGADDAPLSNLFLTLLQHAGVEINSFGHSTGTFTWS